MNGSPFENCSLIYWTTCLDRGNLTHCYHCDLLTQALSFFCVCVCDAQQNLRAKMRVKGSPLCCAHSKTRKTRSLSHWPQSVHVWNPQMGPAVEEKQEIGKPDKTQSHGRTVSLIDTLLTVCMWALVEILSWIVSVLWWDNKGDCTSRQTSGRSLTITLIKSSRGSKVRLSEGAYGPQATSTFSGSATNEECGVEEDGFKFKLNLKNWSDRSYLHLSPFSCQNCRTAEEQPKSTTTLQEFSQTGRKC